MLSEKERECLEGLEAFSKSRHQWIVGWARPMDVGGRDASHHSGTLRQLSIKGLAECKYRYSDRIFSPDDLRARKGRFSRGDRGGPKVYRITPAGREALGEE